MASRLITILAPVLLIVVFGANGGILGPLIPDVAREFGLRVETAGWLFSIMFTGALLATLVGGYLADRFGKKLLFLITVALFSGGFFLFATAPSFPVVALAALLVGASGGTLEGLCSAIIADLSPRHLHRNMNLLQVAFSLGAVGALALTAWFKTRGIPWQTPFLALGGTAAMVGVAALAMRLPAPLPGERMSLPIARRVATDRAVVLLALAIALYVGSEMSLAGWISPILQETFRDPRAPLAAALFWAAMGLGRIISGELAHRFSAYRVLSWLIAGGLVAFLVLLALPGARGIWVGALLAGFTFSGVWPLLVGLGAAHYPAYTGTVVALLVTSGTLGGALFPTLSGYVLERLSLAHGLGLMAVLYLGLAGAVWAYGRHRGAASSPLPHPPV